MQLTDDHLITRATMSQARPEAIALTTPLVETGALIVACPHSGRFYPPELLAASRLDAFSLRRSEDAYVDELFADAPSFGAYLMVNTFARAFVDVNRSEDELDPKLITDLELDGAQTPSERVKAGLGVIPRTVGEGIAIYPRQLQKQDAVARLREVHTPWHDALEARMATLSARNGAAILLDCHSMPNCAAGDPAQDIVLGDRFGDSCAPLIMSEAIACLRGFGLKVTRNNPFAGGYATKRHGNVMTHHHALQIEINRSLYMVEGAMTRRPSFNATKQAMAALSHCLVQVSASLKR